MWLLFPSSGYSPKPVITEICLVGAVLVKNIEPRRARAKFGKRQHLKIITIFNLTPFGRVVAYFIRQYMTLIKVPTSPP